MITNETIEKKIIEIEEKLNEVQELLDNCENSDESSERAMMRDKLRLMCEKSVLQDILLNDLNTK